VFRKMRNLHLWIGLITSIIILMEAVTGLMLAHPSLMGMESRAPIIEGNSRTTSSDDDSISTSDQGQITANQSTLTTNESSSNQNSVVSNAPSSSLEGKTQSDTIAPRRGGSRNQEADNSLMGLVKGLHEGKLGNLNITWVIDLAAISMIVLTISGMYLSIRILRRQRKSD